MDGEGARSNGCAIGVWAPRVDGPEKTDFLVLWYPETTQKRLRNGSRDGRETLDPATSASPIGHSPSWEVPLISDKEPSRAGHASAQVSERPFPPSLYVPCATRTHARAHAPAAGKQAGQTLACCKMYKKSLSTLKLSHTCAWDADLAIGTML
jgi:hypothetical protein